MSTLCTLFTSTKPFSGHDAITQRNALANWRALGLRCIIMGDDAGAAEAAEEFGFTHLPDIAKTSYGTPLLSDMFEKAQASAATRLVCYINADILLPPSFLAALEHAQKRWENFLLIGQRWDVDVLEKLEFDDGWPERLETLRQLRGKLHSPWGLDYFAFPRGMLRQMPPFAIGRPGWDIWLVWTLAGNGTPLLNVTCGVPVLHQNHAYKHVPAGREATYSGPEGDENMRLSAEHAPALNTRYASTYRAEWRFDGERITLDESLGRWWWYTRYRRFFPGPRYLAGLLLRCLATTLRRILSPKHYDLLRAGYRKIRKIDDMQAQS